MLTTRPPKPLGSPYFLVAIIIIIFMDVSVVRLSFPRSLSYLAKANNACPAFLLLVVYILVSG